MTLNLSVRRLLEITCDTGSYSCFSHCVYQQQHQLKNGKNAQIGQVFLVGLAFRERLPWWMSARSNISYMAKSVRKTRFIPASTFKIPHALFALDAGVVRDEFQVFPWDGVKRQFESWNRDQDLRSSMRASTVWVYQSFARQLGETREQEYLERIAYGNTDVSGGVDRFWLDGGLRISAPEQIVFLQRLHRNTLPFAVEHQRLVKDVMIVEAGRDWILRAKSGWAVDVEPQIGWYVGFVEWPDGPVFFALNIDMPGRAKDVAKREAIVRAVLRSIQALPPN